MKLGTTEFLVIGLPFVIAKYLLPVVLAVLAIRALWKYLHTKNDAKEKTAQANEEKAALCKTLGEALKAERTRCNMTQELVADSLGVSRQAVSKWENGTADPSTSNLLAIAKLYGVSAEELLKKVEQ